MLDPTVVKALLFDMGGIVIEIDFNRAFELWQRRSQLSLQEIRQRFKMDKAYERHERGEIEAGEYFQHLRNVLELDATDQEIVTGWNAIFVGEITTTLDDILLAKNKFPCFAFTNSNPTHQSAWMAACPNVVAAFDRIFVSSELGLRKPEQAAFEAIAEATGIDLSAMLFFDDTMENIEGARAAGLQAVYVQRPEDVKQALRAIGAL